MIEWNFHFSEVFNVSVFKWSPDGLFLARAVHKSVLILNVRDDLLTKARTLPDKITTIEWSGDSSYYACCVENAHFQCGIHVFSVDNPSWKCRFNFGDTGVLDFSWSSDARHLLTTALDYVQLTIWSISDTTKVIYIRDILPITQNKSINSNGIMALAQFDEKFSPCISLYDTSDWQCITTFRVICKDLKEVVWSPNGSSILLCDSMLFNNVYIYSSSGELIKHYAPEGLSIGVHLTLLTLFSPTGQLLLCMYHRNIIRVLNGLTYGLLLEEKLEPSLPHNYTNCQMISEVVSDVLGTGDILLNNAYKQELDCPIIPSTVSKTNKNFQYKVKFSWDGRYVALWADSFATTVWIYDYSLSLAAVLIHLNNVSDFDWHPSEIRLCICTHTNLIYFWSPESYFIKPIANPAGNVSFQCKNVQWNPSLNSIALRDNDKLIMCDIS